MPEIRLVKRYPHIKDEDVTSIFQEGYIKGFENGRKGTIPVEWIEKRIDSYIQFYNKKKKTEPAIALSISNAINAISELLDDWREENEI